jgi:hypothetical protein
MNTLKKPLVYGCLAVTLLVVIIVFLGAGFGTGSFKEEEKSVNTAPAPAPTAAGGSVLPPTNGGDDRADRVRSYLVSVAANGDDSFSDPLSPESKALLWLQEKDPLLLDPVQFESLARLDQRYVLLALWFQADYDWFGEENWLSEDECTWKGVTCELVSPDLRRNLQEGSSVVVGLNMEANNLQGSIPTDIGLLQFLLTLNLSKNQLEGEIPPSIKNLEFLQELYLDTNELSGELQNVDFKLFTNMNTMDLSFNELSGPIPDSIWSMTSLERLILDENSLTGSISGSIGNVQSLGKKLLSLLLPD